MNFPKKRNKLFFLLSIFIIFNIIPKIFCLIEFPISKSRSYNINKCSDFIPDISIPDYVLNKILLKNPNFFKSYKKNINNNKNNNIIYSSSGDITIVPNSLFIITVKLGTSKQLFNLLIDTGSSVTWVPIKDSNDLYPISHHYDPSLSLTSKKKSEKPFQIIYGSGSANGSYYTDKMFYIDDKEFLIDFGAANKTNFYVYGADGILGLARKYDDYDKSFINMICKGHVTDSKIFSIKLGINSTYDKKGSFYIGKHDDFNKKEVVSCELNNDNYYEVNYWSCNVLSFSIESKLDNITLTSEKKVSVIFDTGTNAIFLPYYYLQNMLPELEKIDCYIKKYTLTHPQRYQIICSNNLPDFNINIDGHTFILPGKYFFKYDRRLAFSDIYFQESIDDNNEVFIIGSPFFMLFHVLFDSYSKELFFYPEIEGIIIKGSWWNKKHIINVVFFIFSIIFTIGLIVLFIFWNKKYKLNPEEKLDDKIEIKSYFGLL